MSQSGVLNVTAAYPSIPTLFIADSGSAIPISNTLNILGGTGITTSGSGSTVTVTLDTPVTVANGGTGQSSYIDGQILIGNTIGNTLDKATLTAGAGVNITNAGGSITISATNEAIDYRNSFLLGGM